MPVMAPHGHPLGELVLTVLSQSTNDRNRDVAFLRLRDRFAVVGGGARRARGGGRGGDPARRHLKVKSARIQDHPARDRRIRPRPRLAARRAASPRRATPDRAARRRAQDGRLRAAVRLRPARRARRHARLARRRAAAACSQPGAPFERAARRRCSRSRRRAPSSSSTSTCCATGGARATRGARPARACALRADVPEPRAYVSRHDDLAPAGRAAAAAATRASPRPRSRVAAVRARSRAGSTRTVGRDYSWTDRAGWSDADWAAWARRRGDVGAHRAAASARAYFELRIAGRASRCGASGCSPRFTAAASAAGCSRRRCAARRSSATRVWLHTCTLDGPAALPNYRARGMVPYRTETTER